MSANEKAEPIRILQVVTIMNRGGLETMLMNYYRNIDRDKIQFDFMVHREEAGAYEEEIKALGGKIYRMPPIHPKYFKSYRKKLDLFFKEHSEYKIVHSHIDLLSTFVLRAAKNNKVPVRIAHGHNTNITDRGLRKLFKTYSRMNLNAQCTDFFACSKEAGEFVFGKNIVNDPNFLIIKNAIDTNKFLYRGDIRNRIRNEMELQDKKIIGHVGRFNLQKNHEFIIGVFNECCKFSKEVELVLIGEGELKNKIEEKAEKLGLKNRIHFLGQKDNVNEYMMAMDCFLFPSIFEGLGIVLVEAQATGLPIVASDIITKEVEMTDLIRFYSLGLKEKEWAKEIIALLNIPREEIFPKGIVENGYEIKTESKKLTNWYINALKGT